ncbi:hypothetical protein M2141_000530, partial [Lachnospiraceae bacterium PH5-48]
MYKTEKIQWVFSAYKNAKNSYKWRTIASVIQPIPVQKSYLIKVLVSILRAVNKSTNPCIYRHYAEFSL